MSQISHNILSFERRNSGAFEHAWGLAQNLHGRGFKVNYYSHWFNSRTKKVNLKTEESIEIQPSSLKDKLGIFHLQSHTWEYDGLLKLISKNQNSKIIYHLHAVIPYFHLNARDKIPFLNKELPYSVIEDVIKNKLNEREKSQLTAIEKSDHLFTISKGHKKALELCGINKPISVFENVSDVSDIDPFTLNKAKIKGKRLREKLNSSNVILYCGKLYEKKGSASLFDSFQKIKDAYPSLKLILLGAREKKIEDFVTRGLDSKLVNDVILVPWINKSANSEKDEFLKYYFASDVLIQPMITENLYAKTVIDAMSLGIPTITCKSDYTIGSSENAEAIIKSFCYLKSNPEKVKKIVESAKAKIKRENTWDSYVSRLNSLLSKGL